MEPRPRATATATCRTCSLTKAVSRFGKRANQERPECSRCRSIRLRVRAVRRALAAAQQSGTPESMTLPAEQAALALHRALVATPPEPTEPAVNALANALLPFRASHHAERKALEEALALIDYAITRAVRRRR